MLVIVKERDEVKKHTESLPVMLVWDPKRYEQELNTEKIKQGSIS